MEKNQDNWSLSILYGLAWLICSLLVIVDVLMVRSATMAGLSAIQANRVAASATGEAGAARINASFQLTAIDQGILFGGGILAVALAIAIEYYFRMGQKQGLLVKRVGIVTGIEVAVLIVCILALALI